MQHLVDLSEQNPNYAEALKGYYGSEGKTDFSCTVVKDLVFIVLYAGADVDYVLPRCYDGFVQCSDGSTVSVHDSKLICSLKQGVTRIRYSKT